MNSRMVLNSLMILGIVFIACSSSALESLSPDQMRQTVGRAGIDIAISNAATEIYNEHITLSSPDLEPSTHYMRLNGVHSLTTVNTGISDQSGDGTLNHFSLDVGLFAPTNQVMLFAKSPDLSIVTDLTVDSINWCGTDIGGLTVDDLVLSSFHLIAGPHTGTGLDFELGKRTRVGSLVWQYGENLDPASADDDNLALRLSGICFAESFDAGNNFAADGEFKIGDLDSGKPATVDVTATVDANTGESRAFIAVNLPMQGSLRIDNVTLGGTDFGALTVDNFEAEVMRIEIPGRGLGKITP